MNRSARFPIRFEPWYRVFSSLVFLPPSGAWVDVGDDEVECRMGWAFRARFPRAAVKSVGRASRAPLSRGVHGFAGRWLVNGAGAPIVSVELAEPQRAWVLGIPVRLRELQVSVDDPDALAARLRPA
jgi:hypothetical protein